MYSCRGKGRKRGVLIRVWNRACELYIRLGLIPEYDVPSAMSLVLMSKRVVGMQGKVNDRLEPRIGLIRASGGERIAIFVHPQYHTPSLPHSLIHHSIHYYLLIMIF